MRHRFLFLAGLSVLLGALLLGCSLGRGGLSRITPTPTKTPRHPAIATLTPTTLPLPSDTPLPTETLVPPTDMPAPTTTPLPTEAPLLPSDTPLPTDTPVPTATPLPTTSTPAPAANTPRPAATKTPAPPTNTPKPKVDYRVKEIIAFEDGSLAKSGLHNVYFTVIDAGGRPLDGITVQETNNPPAVQLVTGSKGPGKAEFTLWGTDYKFKVVGNTNGQAFSSEETHVLSIVFGHQVWDDLVRGGICANEASCRALGQIHFSYRVTFQKTS